MSHGNVTMAWTNSKFPNLNVVPYMSKIRESSTVLSHYHYKLDLNLGCGRWAMIRIACLCKLYTDQLDKDQIPGAKADHLHYVLIPNYKHKNIWGSYNDWIIVVSKDINEDDLI